MRNKNKKSRLWANMFLSYLWQKFLSRFRLGKSELREGNFVARVLKSNEIEKAYRFRYKIFCEELKWLPLNEEKKEKDVYDQHSIHFGILSNKNELVGCARFILPKDNFMLEREFKDLLHNHYILRKKDAVEISRLAVDNSLRKVSNFRNNFNTPLMLLSKIMYQWSIRNKIRYWYITIQPDFLKSLQELFPWKQIGKIIYYQPGVATTTAVLDLREAENFVFKTNQKLFEWFNRE